MEKKALAVFLFLVVFLVHFTAPVMADNEMILNEAVSVIEQTSLYPFDPVACREEVRRAMFDPNYEKVKTSCLDPWFWFMPADEVMNQSDSFAGIGASFILNSREEVEVFGVRPDGPAEKAGVQKGDILKAIKKVGEQKAVPVETFEKALSRLEGEIGDKIFLTLERHGVTLVLQVIFGEIERREVFHRSLSNGVLYVQIREFSLERTPNDVRVALEEADSDKPLVIIDVRGNPGGHLYLLKDVVCEFATDAGDIVVVPDFSRGKFNSNAVFICESVGEFNQYKVVVLADEYTMSSAEIFTGVLHEWSGQTNRFRVLGEKTFGKGVGQTMFLLSDGSLLGVTTVEFLLGNNQVKLNGTGVSPDYLVVDSREGFKDTGTSKDRQFMEAIRVLQNTK